MDPKVIKWKKGLDFQIARHDSFSKKKKKLQEMTPKTYTKACGRLCMYTLIVPTIRNLSCLWVSCV